MLKLIPPTAPRWVKIGAAIAAVVAALLGAGSLVEVKAAPPALSPACCGSGPVLVGPELVEPHRLVRLTAEEVDAKAALLWRVSPAEKVDRATTPRGRLEFSAPPGEYLVELLVITVGPDGAAGVAELRHRVRIGAAPPVTPPEKPPVTPPETPKPDVVGAIGRIQFGNAGCTATVVGPRRADGRWDIFTAAHCTESGIGSKGTMSLKSGKKVAVTVTARNEAADVCWLVTDQDPGSLPFALLGTELPPVGTAVWHQGYGVDRPGNREDGEVTGVTADGKLQFTLNVSSGDSGGAIVRADTNEVVASVCCTRAKGVKTTMFGGHCISGRKIRPGNVDDLVNPPAE